MVLVCTLLLTACGNGDFDSQQAPATSRLEAEEQMSPIAYDLQGHRGARGLRPENTLPGFETALDLEVSTLELDLHLTADGTIVVWHDPVIDRAKCGLAPAGPDGAPDPDDVYTTDRDLLISQLTLAQVAGYRCDRNPDTGQFPDQKAVPGDLSGDNYAIVTIGELFDFVAAYARSDLKTESQRANAERVVFNVETKRRPDRPHYIGDDFDGDSPGLFEKTLLDEIESRELGDRVIVQSFDHRSLWAVQAVAPHIRLSALTLPDQSVDFDELAQRGASIWSPHFGEVDPASLTAARDAGLAVIPYTVNNPDDMEHLIEIGVDGIITDRPDLAPRPSR